MDEVAYWVSTKRAPCLMTYDQEILRKKRAICGGNYVEGATHHKETSPIQKAKRKLPIIEDESVLCAKSPEVFYDVEGDQQRPVKCKAKSNSDSDVDFNIKNPSVQTKSKRLKFHDSSSKSRLQKNKIITSTPKNAVNLRRSPRKTVNNNISLWETNFSRFGCTNGVNLDYVLKDKSSHTNNKTKRNLKFDSGDQLKNDAVEEKHIVNPLQPEHDKYEEESDVSGFTANYIRSTKVHKSSRQRKLPRGKKKSLTSTGQKHVVENDDSLVICYNKAVNTNDVEDDVHNSTDSSHVMNLVSKSNGEGPLKVNRNTSLLKFIEPKINKVDSEAKCKHLVNQSNKTEVNIPAQSKSSKTARNLQRKTRPSQGKNLNSNRKAQFSCKNEVSRREEVRLQDESNLTGVTTRSGRTLRSQTGAIGDFSIGENLHEHSILKNKPTVSTSRNLSQVKNVTNSSRQSRKRESIREKSGFSVCFTDSEVESDSDAKQKKFFR